jgi:thiol-disulfide isomerase/thioredoxin
MMFDFFARFARGLKYGDFLAAHGTDEHRRRWANVYEAVRLTPAQRELLGGFQRQMKLLCVAGTWCGDCVNQCPIFERFAEASEVLDVRYFDRDAHPDLAGELKICGGARVPVVVFLSEDGQQVGWYGDRTLAKYRQLTRDQLGSSCPTGIGAPDPDLLAAVTQDWLNEFERVQLLLRLSSRLRQLHGD